ncbi:hypothetical protein TNCV_3586971 [Trichonephila clavipes]|nr:hypothetical protein TNCV_3586971 [Trichonephila clavipes]
MYWVLVVEWPELKACILIGGRGRRKWEWLNWWVLAVTKNQSPKSCKQTRSSSAICRQGSMSKHSIRCPGVLPKKVDVGVLISTLDGVDVECCLPSPAKGYDLTFYKERSMRYPA